MQTTVQDAAVPAGKPGDLRTRWDALRREEEAIERDKTTAGLPRDDARVQARDARVEALVNRRGDVAAAAWARKARGLNDLLLLAEIAYDLHWDLPSFPALPPDIGDEDYEREAVACLIRGVAEVAEALPSAPTAEPEPNRDWLAP